MKIPLKTGCYLMKDAHGDVIYVGKAKNLRSRVASYWRVTDVKTVALVCEIADIETILTKNEVEALILEMQLIQKHHPKYNIDLQTPGRYAFIKITNDFYPRLLVARKVEKDGRYIGPFPSATARSAALSAAYRIFRLCKKPMSLSRSIGAPSGVSPFAPENGAKRIRPSGARAKKSACFRYHLALCGGACAGIISPEDYRHSIKAAEKFLKGDYQAVIRETEKEMRSTSGKQEFEKARLLRDQLFALKKIEEQRVSHPKAHDQDVIGYRAGEERMVVQLFHFSKGIIAGRREFAIQLDRVNVGDTGHAFQEFIQQYYSSADVPREVIIRTALPEMALTTQYLSAIRGHAVTLSVPQKGLKKKLIELVETNLESAGSSASGGHTGGLTELSKVLRLQSLPSRIACIDISHLGGTQTVGSLVTFVNGHPAKSGYRKFIIKGGAGNNDVASINEVVTRFCARVLSGKERRPDLLMIDGGRGQLNSARKALEKIDLSLPTIGLAKRLEEIFVSWSRTPILLKPTSPALQLLQRLRDEAHRFAITFQRKRRKLTGHP
ncbi:MAG: excinuclease ABC subunit UvrC [Patescibacteria group bacterium]